ncbi:MAG: FprA family A-type flavoprotein [Candidatus Ranarchaeia archaeon]
MGIEAVKIVDDVYWVGAIDWDVRNFHGFHYSTHRGTTYNAYLIIDEKITLIDTVDRRFADEMMARIASVINPDKIEYVIANHGESDHSGALPLVLGKAAKADLITSVKGAESIPAIQHGIKVSRTVKNGERLGLGRKTLTFIEAPMLHWPDSMFTYLEGDAILFSNDAFGQHLASSRRFNDQVDQKYLMDEAAKYYANILTPFSKLVLKKINELTSAGLPINIIAPSHGIIWRKNPLQIVEAYVTWAKGETQPRLIIGYESMWDSTRQMAHAIAEGAIKEGVDVSVYDLAINDRTDILRDFLDARAIVIGSATINRGFLPHVAPLLSELKGLRFPKRIGAAFGSYGWGGGAIKEIERDLSEAGIEVVEKGGLGLKWSPTSESLARCIEFGSKIALHIKNRKSQDT